jgi:hypothetical protein
MSGVTRRVRLEARILEITDRTPLAKRPTPPSIFQTLGKFLCPTTRHVACDLEMLDEVWVSMLVLRQYLSRWFFLLASMHVLSLDSVGNNNRDKVTKGYHFRAA